VRARGEATFTGAATDGFGNVTPTVLSWTVTPATLGTVVPGRDGTVSFRAGRVLGNGTITASANGGAIVGSATVVVRPASLRIAPPSYRRTVRGVLATLVAVDAQQRPVSRATFVVVARLDGRRALRTSVVTGAAGKARVSLPFGKGCYTIAVTRASAQGFIWSGRTPRNRFCRR
jgi:hypothetical protein